MKSKSPGQKNDPMLMDFNRVKVHLIFLNTVYILAGAGLLCIYIGVQILEPPIEFANEFFVLGPELIATMFAVMIILYVTFPEPSDDSPLVFHYIILTIATSIFEGVNIYLEILAISRELRAESLWMRFETSARIKFMEANRCYPYGVPMNFDDIPISVRLSCFSDPDCRPCGEKLANIYGFWNDLISYWGIVSALAKIPGIYLILNYLVLRDELEEKQSKEKEEEETVQQLETKEQNGSVQQLKSKEQEEIVQLLKSKKLEETVELRRLQ